MFLITEKRKNGTNLCIVESYRDPVTKKTKKRRIKNLGYLEDLKKQYDDPISHFKEVARQMTLEQQSAFSPMEIELDPSESLEPGVDLIKNYGYIVLSSIYHKLKLDSFFNNRQRTMEIAGNLNNMMKLLVYGSILYPGSISQIYRNKNQFFEHMDFDLDDIYIAFRQFQGLRAPLLNWLEDNMEAGYRFDTSVGYCVVSRHYFEDKQPETQSKTGIKEYYKDPTVEIAVLTDRNGLPITYDLVSQGDSNDVPTVRSKIAKKAKSLGIKNLVLIGDNGVNSPDTLYENVHKGQKYMVAQSIRSAADSIKKYALDYKGYIALSPRARYKSRIIDRTLRVKTPEGSKTVRYKEKEIILYNETYARCIKSQREDMLLKAKDLIASPSRFIPGEYTQSRKSGGLQYSPGRIFKNQGAQPFVIDEESLNEEEKYDGYYLFRTSQIEQSDEELISAYTGLWEIEKSFSYIDNTYHIKPRFIRREEHMQAHYLISYLALVLTRILQLQTDKKYPLEKMLRSLRKCNCVQIDGNNYVQSYNDDILIDVGNSMEIDFSKRFGTLAEIKENLGYVKKPDATK